MVVGELECEHLGRRLAEVDERIARLRVENPNQTTLQPDRHSPAVRRERHPTGRSVAGLSRAPKGRQPIAPPRGHATSRDGAIGVRDREPLSARAAF